MKTSKAARAWAVEIKDKFACRLWLQGPFSRRDAFAFAHAITIDGFRDPRNPAVHHLPTAVYVVVAHLKLFPDQDFIDGAAPPESAEAVTEEDEEAEDEAPPEASCSQGY